MFNILSIKHITLALGAGVIFCADATAVKYSPLLMQHLHGCTTIVSPKERVDCYDKLLKIPATIGLKTVAPSNNVIVPPVIKAITQSANTAQTTKAQVNPDIIKTQQLGSKYLTGTQKDRTELKVSLFLLEAKKDKSGKWTFYFANGQVWQQLEAKYISMPKNKPLVSSLSAGVMGSFDLRIGQSDRVIKVKRVK